MVMRKKGIITEKKYLDCENNSPHWYHKKKKNSVEKMYVDIIGIDLLYG